MSINKLTKTDINPSEWEFEFQQRNKNCVLIADTHTRGVYHNLAVELKLDVPAYDYIFTNNDRGYIKRNKKTEVLRKLKDATRDEEYLKYVFENSTFQMEQYGKVVSSVLAQIIDRTISNEKLSELWTLLDEAYQKMQPWFYIPWYISEENMLTEPVKEGLDLHTEKIEKICSIDDALGVLIFPVKKVVFQKEQGDFFELVKIAQEDAHFLNNGKFREKAEKYLINYGWVKTYFFLPIDPMSLDELIEKIKISISEKSIFQYELQEKAQKKNTLLAEKLMDLLKNDAELINKIKNARELGYVLTAGVDIGMREGSKARPFYDLVAYRIGIRKEDLQHLTSSEIISALNGEQIDKEELESRKIGYIYALVSGETFVSSGKEGVEITEWFESAIRDSVNGIEEFKGQPACKGKAKGLVKIALLPQDSYSLKEGEILICSMTSPDYVPAMKRSAAIVTDEGGLLSHAAIMSREFGKPCIVGTKIASQVLKDGDLVEVDAERGVVRIIEKHV